MTTRNYSNTAVTTTLVGAINDLVVSMVVNSVSGFPTSYPYSLVINIGEANEEVVTVSNAVGTTLTIIRGEDGTVAASHLSGASITHGLTARDVYEPQVHMNASTNIHGLSGGAAVVGTSQSQTLTNKTISGASNTLTNIPAANVTGTFSSVTTSGNVSAVDVAASGDMTVGDDLTVTDAIASASLTTTGNVSVGGNLTVTGTGPYVKASDIQVFTGSGTWTKPANAKLVWVRGVGGGGGGGGTGTGAGGAYGVGAGGGGGGYCESLFAAGSLGATETVTVGTGGAGGSGNNPGATGNNTTFGSHFTASGGSGGAGTTATPGDSVTAGGQGGGGSSGNITNHTGGDGGHAYMRNSLSFNTGYGGGTVFCTGRLQPTAVSSNGNAGRTNSGGGGSGAVAATTAITRDGGAGATGIVIAITFT